VNSPGPPEPDLGYDRLNDRLFILDNQTSSATIVLLQTFDQRHDIPNHNPNTSHTFTATIFYAADVATRICPGE